SSNPPATSAVSAFGDRSASTARATYTAAPATCHTDAPDAAAVAAVELEIRTARAAMRCQARDRESGPRARPHTRWRSDCRAWIRAATRSVIPTSHADLHVEARSS